MDILIHQAFRDAVLDGHLEHLEWWAKKLPNELPAMKGLARKRTADDDRRGRVRQVGLDVVKTDNAGHFGHVQRTVQEGDAVRRIQPARDDVNLPGLRRTGHGIYDSALAGADEQRPVVAQCHRARPRNAACIDGDFETCWQLDGIQGQASLGIRRWPHFPPDQQRREECQYSETESRSSHGEFTSPAELIRAGPQVGGCGESE